MKYLTTITISLFIMHVLSRGAFAQTITLAASESAQTAASPAAIQYDLPYPGILPDHPLYFFKVARDRLVGFLINDPIKKAEFNVLQSDKKIFAAQLLFDKDADQMGIDTLSKSNNYMHNAISDTLRARDSKLNTEALLGKIETSIKKHKEVIENLKISNATNEKALHGELERLQTIEDYHKKSFPKRSYH